MAGIGVSVAPPITGECFMKIAVVGAGIIGITTAYELASDGHQVQVIERRGAAAEESSFANAGVIAPGYVTPWAAPGMPLKVCRYLFSDHSPVRLTLPLAGRDLRWMWHWYRACTLDRYLASRRHMHRLALYSRDRLHHITRLLNLNYERSEGYLVLLRSETDSQQVQAGLNLLRETGVKFREIDPAETRKIEPALHAGHHFFGAIHLPEDEVGNCRQFALQLKHESMKGGVDFSFNTVVNQIHADQGVKLAIAGEPALRAYDACVVCAGTDSAALLRPFGLNIPLAPIHGYSISAPIQESMNAPKSAVMDERYKVAISRLGNRVRVAGGAELGGQPGKKRAAAILTLYKVLQDWFPGAANLSGGVQEWKGARPMLPDGPPLIGATRLPHLWLNIGHGSSGWALSCGSARVLADMVAGKVPALDVFGFDLARIQG